MQLNASFQLQMHACMHTWGINPLPSAQPTLIPTVTCRQGAQVAFGGLSCFWLSLDQWRYQWIHPNILQKPKEHKLAASPSAYTSLCYFNEQQHKTAERLDLVAQAKQESLKRQKNITELMSWTPEITCPFFFFMLLISRFQGYKDNNNYFLSICNQNRI